MLTLILGGARSGKSDMAERLAASSRRPVLYVATMEPGDAEVRARIATHQAGRPPQWRTVETPIDLTGALSSHARADDFIIVDCATLWVSNLLINGTPNINEISPDTARRLIDESTARAHELATWCSAFDGDVAIVSNDVGSGVVPPYPLGRVFRDALGGANRVLAARADRVYYLVAGCALDLRALGAAPIESFGGADA